MTATAVDASGHRVQKTFTITVTDSMPPTVVCPTDILKATDAGTSNAVVHFTVTATDNVPGVSVSCSPASGSTFQLGITTVVCAARDARGNTANCMFTVTVIDREAPVLTGSDLRSGNPRQRAGRHRRVRPALRQRLRARRHERRVHRL